MDNHHDGSCARSRAPGDTAPCAGTIAVHDPAGNNHNSQRSTDPAGTTEDAAESRACAAWREQEAHAPKFGT